MSLSPSKESLWLQHQESLKTIRGNLRGGRRAKSNSPVVPGSRKSLLQQNGRARTRIGRSNSNTPPYLPRLDTPPEHDRLRQNKNLRGSKFHLVPPVKFSDNDDDSWGEESDDGKDSEYGQANYMPQPFPYPVPMYPPAVIYPGMPGQPYVFYPPPPGGYRQPRRDKDRKKSKGRANQAKKKSVSFRKTPENFGYESDRTSHMLQHMKQSQSSPAYRGLYADTNSPQSRIPVPSSKNGYTTLPNHVQRVDLFDEDRNPVLKKYKYIYPNESQSRLVSFQSPIDDRRRASRNSKALDEAHIYLRENPGFAGELVELFIEESLESDILPHLLVNTLYSTNRLGPDDPLYYPSGQVSEDLLTREVETMVRELVKESTNELVNQYMGVCMGGKDPLEEFLTQLLNEAVGDALHVVVKETTQELADDILVTSAAKDVITDLITEEVYLAGPDLVEQAIFDLLTEDFIDEEVIWPEVEEESAQVATEMMEQVDNTIRRRELKVVSGYARNKISDSLCLDYLLSLVSRHGKAWTQSDFANRAIDGLALNLLLEQFFQVREDRARTIDNVALKRVHEKAVTDVALDAFLGQLSAALDEDMTDMDEYERGISMPPINGTGLVSRVASTGFS